MLIVTVPTDRITDWPSFHQVYADTFGFLAGYGRNGDAWIDCMRRLDTPDDGMSRVKAPPGEPITLDLGGRDPFRSRCPDQYAFVVEASAAINAERIDRGQGPLIVLAFRW